MKRGRFYFFLAVLLVLAVSVFSLYSYYQYPKKQTQYQIIEQTQQKSPAKTQKVISQTQISSKKSGGNTVSAKKDSGIYEYFFITEYDGKIGVFVPQNLFSPIEILDVNINHLPKFDQQDLQNGIWIGSQEELNRLIEDFMN